MPKQAKMNYLFGLWYKQMLNDILWPDHIQWHPPTGGQTLYRTRPFTEFWVVSIEHLRRVWHADRGRLLLRKPGPVPLGLAYVLLVETNPFPNLSLFFRTMLFKYPSVLSRFCILRLQSSHRTFFVANVISQNLYGHSFQYDQRYSWQRLKGYFTNT